MSSGRVLNGEHTPADMRNASLMKTSFSIRNSSPATIHPGYDRSLKSASEKIASIDLCGPLHTPDTDHFSWANNLICDEVEDPSLFSNNHTSWGNAYNHNRVYPRFPFPRAPSRESNKFAWLMKRYNMGTILDPTFSQQRILCREWIQRHEVLLRRIYFPKLDRERAISINMAADLYARYQGADSPIMSQKLLPWPLREEDPQGIKTFDGCPRPPWLLDYLFSWLSNHFISLTAPDSWGSCFKNMLISSNLPMSLLHPVELESELGRNFFPVSSRDFSNWIITQDK